MKVSYSVGLWQITKNNRSDFMKLRKLLAMAIVSVVSLSVPVVPVRADVCIKGFGTAEKPFLIEDEEDIINIPLLGSEKHYKMMNDVTLTAENWTPLPTFTGVFDGNGFTIRNLNYNTILTNDYYTDNFGFFKELNNATIKNVNFSGGIINAKRYAAVVASKSMSSSLSNITTNVTINASCDAAGIVANSVTTTYRQCANLGNISVTRSYNTGGIVAHSNSSNFYECYNSANIIGNGYVGGIIGEVVNGTIISDCYNSGNIKGDLRVGGLVGLINSSYRSTISKSFSTGEVIGRSAVASILANYVETYSTPYTEKCVSASNLLKSSNNYVYKIGAGSVSSNLAWDNMPVYIGSTLTKVSGTASNAHGQNTPLEELMQQQTYEALGWNFNNIWIMTDTFPTLKWLPAQVNPNTPSTSVTVTPKTAELEVNNKITLSATVTPENATDKTIVWASSDTSVATVDAATGEVTAVAEGKAVITATTVDGASDTCQIKVTKPLVLNRYNDNDKQVKYVGSWSYLENDSQFYSNDEHYAKNTDAYAELTFLGSQIKWIGATSNNLGKADVYIDDVLVTNIDLYSQELETQKVLFSETNLSNSVHTIKIVPSGSKNELSTDYYVTIDAFDCYETTSDNSFKVNDNSNDIVYSGLWTYLNNDSMFFSNDEHYANDTSAFAELTFTGTKVSWIGATSFNLGKADVYIDGSLAQTVDLYSSILQPQKVLFTVDGLEKGVHTIKIMPNGSKNDLATDYYVTIDAFEFK